MKDEEVIKGYKVFNPDWTCSPLGNTKQYACPGVFKSHHGVDLCNHGMHFCIDLVNCFNYYPFDPENHVAEVIALGQIAGYDDKWCTDELQIVREITWQEVLEMVNTGKGCAGFCNSGDWNSGNCNSGNWNSGNCNSGDWNSGDRNSGDWNKCNFSNGCFNTVEPKIYLFDKPSDWTYRDWLNSRARNLLNQIPKGVVEWIWSSDMTDSEKEEHPEHETTGGYLKVLDESDCGQIWWDGLSEYKRNIIKALPNFDEAIFEQITGIKL